jgi:hypothetical protein
MASGLGKNYCMFNTIIYKIIQNKGQDISAGNSTETKTSLALLEMEAYCIHCIKKGKIM